MSTTRRDRPAGGEPVRAVFPTASRQIGMYESFYLRAVAPDAPVGVWIRHTVHKRPGQAPQGSMWCTVFDADRGAPFMHKHTTAALDVPAGEWISVDGAHLGPTRAEGTCGPARWSLRIEAAEPQLRHLAHEWLYRAPLPRTKLTSPAPRALFDGTLELPGRTLQLREWPGMVGHNWGSEHAERWIWLHGVAFDEDPSAWIDVAIGRVRVGGRMTPWVANGALSLDGRRHQIGGLTARGLRVGESVDRCTLALPGPRGLLVEARVRVPPGAAAGWRYADPDGGEHDVVNCSIAALELAVHRRAAPSRTLRTANGAAYELGMREHDHGVPIAPFPDG